MLSHIDLGLIQNSALTQPSAQATRHARRVYVGGLPPSANEQSIATFMSHALAAIGGTSQGPGVVGMCSNVEHFYFLPLVVNVYINREKNFAFVEFRTGKCFVKISFDFLHSGGNVECHGSGWRHV